VDSTDTIIIISVSSLKIHCHNHHVIICHLWVSNSECLLRFIYNLIHQFHVFLLRSIMDMQQRNMYLGDEEAVWIMVTSIMSG
jgi:hypothetical protein